MAGELLIVNKNLLPKSFEKVAKAKSLLNDGKVNSVSEACKAVDISRGTFYKYQESVFEYKENANTRKLVVSFSLSHKAGSLSKVCDLLSREDVSIITISQSAPIGEIAPVMLSLDISSLRQSVDGLRKALEGIDGLTQLNIIAVE